MPRVSCVSCVHADSDAVRVVRDSRIGVALCGSWRNRPRGVHFFTHPQPAWGWFFWPASWGPFSPISPIWPMGPSSPSWGRFFDGSNFGHSPTQAFTCTTYRHVRLDMHMSASAMTIFSPAQLRDSCLPGACVTRVREEPGETPGPPPYDQYRHPLALCVRRI